VRVLHVCESFGGGVFTVIKELSNGHVAAGLTVGIAYSLREETPADFRHQLDSRIRLYDLNDGKATGRGGHVRVNLRSDLMIISRVLRSIVDFKPDVIHAHSSKAGLVGRLCGLLYRLSGHRARVFYSPHGFAFLRGDVGRATRSAFLWLERCAHAMGGMIVGCSEGEASVARQRIARSRVATIENAVDLEQVPAGRRADRAAGKPRVVTLGRISAQKGPELFAEVARRVSSEIATFVWIGGGTAEAEAELRAMPNVTVTGWVTREEALERLVEADVYLQTSHWEGMPLSVIEALASGVPAVVTDIVGNRDVVVPGVTGLVGGSAEELASSVTRLCTDDPLRRRLSMQAAEMAVKRFALPRFLGEWQQAYENALRG
jgi:glycosyltransferase involved in cell wall biosynthesis